MPAYAERNASHFIDMRAASDVTRFSVEMEFAKSRRISERNTILKNKYRRLQKALKQASPALALTKADNLRETLLRQLLKDADTLVFDGAIAEVQSLQSKNEKLSKANQELLLSEVNSEQKIECLEAALVEERHDRLAAECAAKELHKSNKPGISPVLVEELDNILRQNMSDLAKKNKTLEEHNATLARELRTVQDNHERREADITLVMQDGERDKSELLDRLHSAQQQIAHQSQQLSELISATYEHKDRERSLRDELTIV